MGIVIGVVSSLLAGYTRMFNETDDQAVARQRAQDVFNALEVPIVSCGLGIPTDGMSYYFSSVPIGLWQAPLEIRDTNGGYGVTGLRSGNVLRVVYSVPSGVKNGRGRVSDFVPSDTAVHVATLGLTDTLSMDLAPGDTRNFITFPVAFMSPLQVTSIGTKQISVAGMPQRAASTATHPELAKLIRGEIAPYQDIHLVRAIAAYVDDQSVFHAAEVTATDVSASDPTTQRNPSGFRVEGIRAVQFETDDDHKLLTVRVLAEGEVIDEARISNTPTRTALAGRWTAVTLDPRIFYADFEMTWRIRNYVPD